MLNSVVEGGLFFPFISLAVLPILFRAKSGDLRRVWLDGFRSPPLESSQ